MINPFLRSLFRRNKFLASCCSSFLSRVPCSLGYIVAKLLLNHRKASPCVFNFPFFLSSFLLPEFSMEALHDGSSRISFILILFFKISLGAKICQAILKKNKHGAQHMSCFEEFKYSSFAFRSAILSILSFEVVLCHSWQFPSCFMILVVKNEIF